MCQSWSKFGEYLHRLLLFCPTLASLSLSLSLSSVCLYVCVMSIRPSMAEGMRESACAWSGKTRALNWWVESELMALKKQKSLENKTHSIDCQYFLSLILKLLDFRTTVAIISSLFRLSDNPFVCFQSLW